MTTDELAEQMNGLAAQVNDLATQMNQQFAKVHEKVDEGFKDSKIRDEELRALTKFGLEAREVLRDEMHQRFDEADQKQDQQITLLEDAVRHLRSAK
jgi:hypothetical protein